MTYVAVWAFIIKNQSFVNQQEVGIFHRLVGSEFQTAEVTKLNKHSLKYLNYFFEFLKASRLRIRECVKFNMFRAKLKAKS